MKLKLLVAALIAAVSTSAHAATLDFTSLGSGPIGSTTASVAGADITSYGTDLYVGAGPFTNSICAISGTCDNDLLIEFTSAVTNLTFGHGYWSVGDFIEISIYGIGNALLGTYDINSVASVDLSSFGAITSLFFDDSSTAAGVAYGDFRFDVAQVPLPATLPLLLAGLGAFGVARRRKA